MSTLEKAVTLDFSGYLILKNAGFNTGPQSNCQSERTET